MSRHADDIIMSFPDISVKEALTFVRRGSKLQLLGSTSRWRQLCRLSVAL
jgi:hypothetical protein